MVCGYGVSPLPAGVRVAVAQGVSCGDTLYVAVSCDDAFCGALAE